MSLKQWKATRNKGTPQRVGKFYMHLAQHIFGGKITSDELADIVDWGNGIGYEVKGSDNNHSVRIRSTQLKKHKDSTIESFPLSWYMYCICCYRNKIWEQPGAPLKKCRGANNVFQYLAENITTVYLLDHRIIDAIGIHVGRKKGAFIDREDESISIGHRLLEQFRIHPEKILFELCLQGEWHSSSTMVDFTFTLQKKRYSVSTRVVQVVHADLKHQFDKRIVVPLVAAA
jgi:hypothetical protein